MKRYPDPDMDRYAGVFDRRFEALFLDGLLVAVAMMVVGYVGGTIYVDDPMGGFGGMLVAVQFLTPVAFLVYQIAFEGYYGQTPGKHVRGIVVVRTDGSSMTWLSSIVRNLLRIVDSFPVFYLTGIVVAFVSSKNQRIGDLLGRTVVVYTDE